MGFTGLDMRELQKVLRAEPFWYEHLFDQNRKLVVILRFYRFCGIW
jgi:hypothetical protein